MFVWYSTGQFHSSTQLSFHHLAGLCFIHCVQPTLRLGAHGLHLLISFLVSCERSFAPPPPSPLNLHGRCPLFCLCSLPNPNAMSTKHSSLGTFFIGHCVSALLCWAPSSSDIVLVLLYDSSSLVIISSILFIVTLKFSCCNRHCFKQLIH